MLEWHGCHEWHVQCFGKYKLKKMCRTPSIGTFVTGRSQGKCMCNFPPRMAYIVFAVGKSNVFLCSVACRSLTAWDGWVELTDVPLRYTKKKAFWTSIKISFKFCFSAYQTNGLYKPGHHEWEWQEGGK